MRHPSFCLLSLLPLIFATAHAATLLPPAPNPSSADMAAARQSNPVPSASAVNAVVPRLMQQSNAALDQAQAALRPSAASATFPNVAAMPPAPAGGFDLEAMAKQYYAASKPQALPQPGLYAFVSSSMPIDSLNRLVRDTAKVGGVVFIRGMVGNRMRDTAAWLMQLQMATGTTVQIDPRQFEHFQVTQVPTLVVKETNADEVSCQTSGDCTARENYIAIEGDVSVADALDAVSRQRSVLAPLADHMLDRLHGGQ